MIIVNTKMKKLPEKCTKCKYGIYNSYDNVRICALTQRVPYYVFNKEKNNWEYVKPRWCPLKEVK